MTQIWVNIGSGNGLHKVECCYNEVQGNMILHTSLQLERQNINYSVKVCGVFQENWQHYNSIALYAALGGYELMSH